MISSSRRALLGVIGIASTLGLSAAVAVSCTTANPAPATSADGAAPGEGDSSSQGSDTGAVGQDAGDATLSPGDSAAPSNDGASDAGVDGAVVDSGLDASFDYDGSPLVLALSQPYPTEIAAGGGYVYWTNSLTTGNVMMLSRATVLAGGAPTPTLVTDEYIPRGIAVSTALGAVYWATYGDGDQPGSGTVTMAALGSTTTTTLASVQLGPSELAVDSANLFWLNGGTGVVEANDLSRMTLDGGSPTALTTLSGSSVGHVATDGVNVYWSTANSTILALPVNAPANATPVTAVYASNVDGLVTDGTRLYWIYGGNVVSTPVLGADLDAGADGGVVTTLAPAGTLPEGYLAVDGTYVYWTDQGPTEGEGSVKKVSVTGGSPITLATGLVNPLGIAVDDELVYWTSITAGTVEAAPK